MVEAAVRCRDEPCSSPRHSSGASEGTGATTPACSATGMLAQLPAPLRHVPVLKRANPWPEQRRRGGCSCRCGVGAEWIAHGKVTDRVTGWPSPRARFLSPPFWQRTPQAESVVFKLS